MGMGLLFVSAPPRPGAEDAAGLLFFFSFVASAGTRIFSEKGLGKEGRRARAAAALVRGRGRAVADPTKAGAEAEGRKPLGEGDRGDAGKGGKPRVSSTPAAVAL